MKPQHFLLTRVYRLGIAVIDVLEHFLICFDNLLTGPVPVALQPPSYIDKPVKILFDMLLEEGLNGILLA